MIQPLNRIFIYANGQQEEEIRLKPIRPGVEIAFFSTFPSDKDIEEFDSFFLLGEENSLIQQADSTDNKAFKILSSEGRMLDFKGKPVIIHSTIKTLSDAGLPGNFSRINAWPGFLQRDIWEIATHDTIAIPAVFETLGWKILRVKDEPGLVAARVLAMIINEAYFALKENISTREEIDLAMKMGTNYPFGPFEWANKIGIESIFGLLMVLSKQDHRYKPSFGKDGSYNFASP